MNAIQKLQIEKVVKLLGEAEAALDSLPHEAKAHLIENGGGGGVVCTMAEILRNYSNEHSCECKECQSWFIPKGKGLKQVFCTAKCRNKAWQRENRKAK